MCLTSCFFCDTIYRRGDDMQCRNCNGPIPQLASKCNTCYQKTGYDNRSLSPYCTHDMYGNPVRQINIDYDKNRARKKYIKTIREHQELKQIEKQKQKKTPKQTAAIIFFIAVWVIIIIWAGIGAISEISIAPFAFFIITMLPISLLAIVLVDRPKKDLIIRQREIKLHNCKSSYYVNRDVFGYSCIDFVKNDDGRKIYYYAFYEVDKRNIAYIEYDSKFAEYILRLRKPVYVDYLLPPTVEFRIQDVFDDNVLSSVLQCDLPPKNIPF